MQKITDIENWDRKEYFNHYFHCVPCTYSMSVKVDITNIISKKYKLYPSMLYCITKTVNRHPQFRTALDSKENVVIYDSMHPCYTVFHKDSETFSNIWTEFSDNYDEFLESYKNDISLYGDIKKFSPKPHQPENTFPVSMVPWVSFDGFNLNLQHGYDYLLPIFTMGKYTENNGVYSLPLAVQVHHAVCDGYHLSCFLNNLQEEINSL